MSYSTVFELPDADIRLRAASGRIPAGEPDRMHLHADEEVEASADAPRMLTVR